MKRDHSKLICDVSEIAGVFTNTADLGGLLQKIVEMIAVHMDADVCSIYLFYEDSQELVLKATCGLDSSSIGRVSMKIGDGLTGVALRDLRPVCEGMPPVIPTTGILKEPEKKNILPSWRCLFCGAGSGLAS